MTSYDERRGHANAESKLTAEHDGEVWEAYEVELLEEGWGEETVVEIAELLGRTIEACRQKHYDLRQARTAPARRKVQHNSQWDRGWSSLDDMGY